MVLPKILSIICTLTHVFTFTSLNCFALTSIIFTVTSVNCCCLMSVVSALNCLLFRLHFYQLPCVNCFDLISVNCLLLLWPFDFLVVLKRILSFKSRLFVCKLSLYYYQTSKGIDFVINRNVFRKPSHFHKNHIKSR